MPSIQIGDIPPETYSVLRRRAAMAQMSLEEYLLSLIAEAARPTLDEVLDRAGGRAGGSVGLSEATAVIRSERDRR